MIQGLCRMNQRCHPSIAQTSTQLAQSVAATLLQPVDTAMILVLTLDETATVPREKQVPVKLTSNPKSVKLRKSKKAPNKQSTS
jgi:hypothetical protein